MYHVRQENLPFVGSSHEFVGAEQGDTSVSVFLFHGKPGSGPGPHRHPYDEIQFIREGRGVWTVSGKLSRAALETSLSSRPVRFTASKRSVIHH
jgi:quercetin dioxygenase-like cupin family protein